MRKTPYCMVWLLFAATLPGQVPAGWKVVKSPRRLTRTASPTDKGGGGSCQLAVPGDWVVDTAADRTEGQTGQMKSPNGKIAMSIQEHPPGQTLARAKEVALAFNKDAKTMEDSPKRVWLAYKRAGMTIWNVLTAGNPVCDGQLILQDASMEDTAKKIVMTVRPTK